MLMWCLFLALGLVGSRAEDRDTNNTTKAENITTGAEFKNIPEYSEPTESVTTERGAFLNSRHSDKKIFKAKELDSIVTNKVVKHFGRKLFPDNKRRRVEMLAQHMVDVISEAILVVSKTVNNGGWSEDEEMDKFFQNLSQNTIDRIEDVTMELKELVVDSHEVSQRVANRIVAKAAALSQKKAKNEEVVIGKKAIGLSDTHIAKNVQEFIASTLHSA